MSSSPRIMEGINSFWRFHKGPLSARPGQVVPSDDWEHVNIPHTWNAQDVFADEQPYYRGEGWYYKQFSLNREDKGRQIYLFFGAANQDAVVHVNGRQAGGHCGGYTAFAVDATTLVKFGQANTLLVRLSNKLNPDLPPVAGDMMHFGGIYRPACLLKVSPTHFDLTDAASGVYIDAPRVSAGSADIRVRGFVQNALARPRKVKVRHELLAPDGKRLTRLEGLIEVPAGGRGQLELLAAKISRPCLWSPENPTLYTARSFLLDAASGEILDEVDNTFGIRTVAVDHKRGFLLNGEKYFIRGVGKHQDWQDIGYAVPEENIRQDIRLIREMGANFTKSHYPLSPAAYDEGDRLGVMSWVRIPIMDKVNHTDVFYGSSRRMTEEMIRQHCNHPSVVMWGSACEPLGDADWFWPKPQAPAKLQRHMRLTYDFIKKLDDFTRQLDPLRPTANEFHTDPNPQWYAESGLADIQSINGWNLYQGWYHANLKKLPNMLRRIEGWDKGRAYLIAEHGAGSDTRIHTDQPTIFDFSTEYQEQFHRHHLKVVKDFPRIAGMVVWTLVDFQAAHQANVMPHYNNKGMLTSDRKSKDVYYLMRAHWSDRPMVHIAASHWTNRIAIAGAGRAVRRPIRAYSNLPQVELFHNGRSLGRKKMADCQAVWTVPFVEGVNRLLAKAAAGGRAIEDFREIHFEYIPPDLRKAFPPRLCVNVGQSRTFFTDPLTGNTWIPDRPYKKGLFGHVDGEYYRIWNQMKAWHDIREGVGATIKGTDIDPVFQTFLVGLTDYRIDAPAGDYRVHLHLVEPFTESCRLDAKECTGADRKGRRVFDILINGRLCAENLDLAGQHEEQRAVIRSFDVVCADTEGIRIQLRPVRGKPVLSGILVEKLI
ncbi:MAG: DUF4982 domain-containing protein [Planctomycetes bacterium]|nr:DUF4982 domain-containing protein [Planctomycetota bacterium]